MIGSQYGQALFPQNPGGNLGLMTGVGEDHVAAITALASENGLQVPGAGRVDQPPQPDPDHGPAAHEAGLTAAVEGVLSQVRDSRLVAKAPEQPGLRVEGGVAMGVNLVFVGIDDLPVLYQHRPEGFVAVLCRQPGEANGLSHKAFIKSHIASLWDII